MATVVDSLVVKLGLDTTDYNKGSKQAVENLDKVQKESTRVAKTLQTDGKRAAEFFTQIRNSALLFFGALTAGRGLVNFTRDVISSSAEISRNAANLGVSTESLSKWAGAARQAGGTAQAVVGTFKGLSAALTQQQLTGDSQIGNGVRRLGVSLSDSKGQAVGVDVLLDRIGDKLRALPDRRTAFNIGKEMGIDDGTLNVLLKSKKEYDALMASIQKTSKAEAEAAAKSEAQWQALQNQLEALTRQITSELLPVLTSISKTLTQTVQDVKGPLKDVVAWFRELDQATDGVSTKVIGFGAALAALSATGILRGLSSVAAGLAGIGAAATATVGSLGGLATKITGKTASSFIARAAGALGITALVHSDDVGAGSELPREWREKYKIRKPGVKPSEIEKPAKPALEPKPAKPGTGPAEQKAQAARSRLTLAERNNNPGNLEYRGQKGAVLGDDGRFAAFDSVVEGVAALARQVKLHVSRGTDTLSELLHKWAPPHENNTQAYIAAVSKDTGLSPSDKVDASSPSLLAKIVKGISKHEAGRDYLKPSDIIAGINLAQSRAGNTTSNKSISIGNISITTAATDARGIARDLRAEIVRQSDTGLR